MEFRRLTRAAIGRLARIAMTAEFPRDRSRAPSDVAKFIPRVLAPPWREDPSLPLVDFFQICNAYDVSLDTALVLVNAVYFKGSWASKFNAASTQPRPFHIDATTVKEIPTMHQYGSFHYGELPEVQASFVELPYKREGFGDAVSMFVILPYEITDLAELEKNLDKVNVESLATEGTLDDIDIYLPKFKIESTIDLEESLSKLGLTDMFDFALANFTGIADRPPLVVSKIVQKAFIEVNEEGSEAAAATFFGAQTLSASDEFIADHPFIYAIVAGSDAENKRTLIFYGRYTGPE